ncbi:MAG: type II secretion system protein GspG [Verrucomicrobia bacterium]|nr:type II secretion system protein GspG [Verrucomicrobiota bacterium]
MRPDNRMTKKNKQGMTLMELMVVIAIIMILMGIVVGISGGAQRGAAEAKARAEIGSMALELESYRADKGSYPTIDQGGLSELVRWYRSERYVGVEWDLTDLNGQTPIDPWGRDYYYAPQSSGLFFRLGSRGPDGRFGSSPDANTPASFGRGDDITLRN